MTLPTTTAKRLQLFVLVLLGCALTWLVITRSFVAYLAESSPEAALWLRSGDAQALIRRADAILNPPLQRRNAPAQQRRPALSQATKKQVEDWAKQALLDQPLNSRALRILGQLADKNGDPETAEKLMRSAARFSLRESLAVYWLMRKAYQRKDYATALKYSDVLLRHKPQLAQYVVPMLASFSENDDARPKVVALLAENPPWRELFFRWLPRAITRARTPLNLFLALKATPAPPTKIELANYIFFLNQKNLYNLAYYTWLQFIPPEQLANAGFLFNGGFEVDPDGSPFNWKLMQGSGSLISIRPRPGRAGGRALYVELSQGRVDFRGVRQTVVLAPGRYLLSGRYRGSLSGPRGLRWRITCQGGPAIRISEGPMFVGKTRDWRSFESYFTVPPTACPAQYVQLIFDARTTSERLATGAVWYDDLKISPKFETAAQSSSPAQ